MMPSGLKFFFIVVVPMSVALAGAESANGQTTDSDKRWSIAVVGFFPDANTSFTIDSPLLEEPVHVDYEDDLAVDDTTTGLRLTVGYQLSSNGRHLLELDYLALGREGRATLGGELDLGDVVFPADLTVESDVETQDIAVDYTYMVLKKEGGELGLSIGLHAIRVESTVSGVLVAGEEGEVIAIPARQKINRGFPMPLIGVRGHVDVSSRWRLLGRIKLLSLALEDIEGGYLDALARVEYRASDTIAVGAGYALIDADVERDANEKKLASIIEANYRYRGPEVYLRFSF